MENLSNYFIFGIIAGTIVLFLTYLLIKYGKIITIRDFKKLVAENNIGNEAMIFIMLDRMSFKEMGLLSDDIKTFLKNNFIINLSAYKEGLKLIDMRIDLPEKKAKIMRLLDQLFYEKRRIPFLTKAGYTTAKLFKAEEVRVDLNFFQTPGLKKECYIN